MWRLVFTACVVISFSLFRLISPLTFISTHVCAQSVTKLGLFLTITWTCVCAVCYGAHTHTHAHTHTPGPVFAQSVMGINLDTLRPEPTVEGYTTLGGYSYKVCAPLMCLS